MGGDHDGNVVGEVHRCVGTVGAPARMAVAGKVDREQRPAERERDRVPGVGVLGPAVQQDELRRLGTPTQGADRAPGGFVDDRLDALDDRRRIGIEVELGDVLVEQPELVVVVGRIDRLTHPGSLIPQGR